MSKRYTHFQRQYRLSNNLVSYTAYTSTETSPLGSMDKKLTIFYITPIYFCCGSFQIHHPFMSLGFYFIFYHELRSDNCAASGDSILVVPWKSLLGWLSVSISPKTERGDTDTGLLLKWGDLCVTKDQNTSGCYLKAIFLCALMQKKYTTT